MKKMRIFLLLALMIVGMTSSALAKTTINVPETVHIKLNDGQIVEIDFDEYLYGVVSAEMGTSYQTKGKTKQVGIEALKAQAVAARTFALYNIVHSKYDDYDLTATDSDQVYRSSNVKDIVKKAVDVTSGQIITYNGEVANTQYFSTSGGHTESSENIWVATLPYSRGVDDPYEPYIENNSEWEVRIPASKYGDMKILEYSENGRVTKMQIGDKLYTKNSIRDYLGNKVIKSTWFELSYDEDTEEYVFKGKGFGHGVGMSQYGAMGMAEAGFNYEEILKWYYTGVEITPANADYIEIEQNEEKEKNIDTIETKANETLKENSNKEEKEDKSVKKEEKDNSKTKQVVVEKKKGPLLKRLISTIESWR